MFPGEVIGVGGFQPVVWAVAEDGLEVAAASEVLVAVVAAEVVQVGVGKLLLINHFNFLDIIDVREHFI